MTNLYDAHRQWLERPADERFASLQSLYEFTIERRQRSTEEIRNLSHVKAVVAPGGAVAIYGDSSLDYLTN